MAAQNPPFALQGATGTILHSAELARRMLRTATGGATGVVKATDLAVAAHGTPNMSVDLAAGEVLVAGSATTAQGTYYCYNDATVNLAISASDPTNARIDLVVAKVTDTLSDADTWSLAVVAGTPAPSPSPPAAPANSYVLAQVAVAANATSIVAGNITDKRALAVNDGYFLLGAGAAAVNNPFPASTRAHVQAGTAIVTTDGSGNATVPYPVAFANGVLSTIASVGDTNAGSILATQVEASATTAHFVVHVTTSNTAAALLSATIRINWFAVGW